MICPRFLELNKSAIQLGIRLTRLDSYPPNLLPQLESRPARVHGPMLNVYKTPTSLMLIRHRGGPLLAKVPVRGRAVSQDFKIMQCPTTGTITEASVRQGTEK